jgi:phosphatidylserine/phosphatidylglycerophosphate/cardiolipin synthase-like enzyme
MRLVLLMACLVISIAGVQAFQITEVYPDTFQDGDGDEYFVITGTGPMGSLEISDGEGTIRFPPDAVSGGSITITRDGNQYHQVTGKYPDYELEGASAFVPEPLLSGKVQLGNRKDHLLLMDHGQVIQNLTWPGSFTPRKGQIHVLGPDGSWDERVIMSGSSRCQPAKFRNVTGIAFVSPDCGREIFEDAIRSASRKILVNIYEFTDPGLADLLGEAASRGVEVRVLIEGGPVGGIPEEEQGVIARLSSQGITVFAMSGTGEDHVPYRFDHAKYLVIDDERVFLTTENFKEHSFPPGGLSGNRGWGVLMDSPDLAGYFSRVFSEDMDGPGIIPITGYSVEIPPYYADPYQPVFAPVRFTASSVTPVLSPDTSSLILSFINGTEDRLFISEAYISHWSDGKRNPYLEAAINAARRGVEVRILLDSYYYNTEGEYDNDEIVDEINSDAAREDLPLEAKLIDLTGSGLLKLHAKGVVADDSVFISSINWNENSPVFNREAGLIIEDPASSAYFASVFEKDWNGAVLSPSSRKLPDFSKITTAGFVILFLAGYYLIRRRGR